MFRPDLQFLLTCDAPNCPRAALDDENEILFDGMPVETSNEARLFLHHWRPDLCLWTGGHLKLPVIRLIAYHGVPLILLDADTSGFKSERRRFFTNPMGSALSLFTAIMANSQGAATALEKLGAPMDRLTVMPRLQEGRSPAACSESELNLVTSTVAGRPVWLGIHIKTDELPDVLYAHRQAVRFSHRMLLVLFPDDPADASFFRQALSGSGMRWSTWINDGEIDDNTQILLVTEPEDMSVWTRVAPVTFIGSSMTSGHGGRNPSQVAALGSAILYGPNVERYSQAYYRLHRAGAALAVRNRTTLSQAVLETSAPDKAAAMALAGWDVVTESASVTDRVMDLVQDILDVRETTHARS